MNLAILVVSYNTRDLLRNCLHSLESSLAGMKTTHRPAHVQVFVVDNASHDGSADMVATEFPTVHLIPLQKNLGFSGANNLALEALGFSPREKQTGADDAQANAGTTPSSVQAPDLILLLNPDTELLDDALAQMVAFMATTADAGACGPALCYGDGRFQHGAFRFPGPIQVMLDLLPLAEIPGVRRSVPWLYNSSLNGRYSAQRWQGDAPFPVDFVLGAAMMVRAEAIRQVGVLDDGYFMYCEEMDWCLRLWQAGWRVYAVPTAHVLHHEGQSSQQVRWTAYERLWRSRFRFFGKYPERYTPGRRLLIRSAVRLGLAWRRWQAQHRFTSAKRDDKAIAEELAAYRAVARMIG